jgi:hypothetical protein
MLARALMLVLALTAACSPCKPQAKCVSPPHPQCDPGYVATYCNGQFTCLPPGGDRNLCAPPVRR